MDFKEQYISLIHRNVTKDEIRFPYKYEPYFHSTKLNAEEVKKNIINPRALRLYNG